MYAENSERSDCTWLQVMILFEITQHCRPLRFLAALRTKATVVMLPERFTSQACATCHGQLQDAKQGWIHLCTLHPAVGHGKLHNPAIMTCCRKVRVCTHCNTVINQAFHLCTSITQAKSQLKLIPNASKCCKTHQIRISISVIVLALNYSACIECGQKTFMLPYYAGMEL